MQNAENRHPSTAKQMLTQENKTNVDLIKKTMNEKKNTI